MNNTTTKPSIATRAKTFYQQNPWKGRFLVIFASIILILAVVRLALPQTIIYSATSWLKDRGIDSTIEAININIIDGTVSLVNAKGYKDGDALFNIGLIDVHWHWAPLSEKTVVVTKVELDELAVDIEHFSDEMIVGGVHIPLGAQAADEPAEPDENAKAKPWAASLGEVIFTNLNVCYLQNSSTIASATDQSKILDYCVKLDELGWGGTISYATDPELSNSSELPLSSTGNFQLNGLTVIDNTLDKQLLSSTSNTLSNVTISGLNNIQIELLEMNGLSALQRDDADHKDAVRFQQLTIKDIRFNNLNSLAINSIAVKDPGLYLIKLNDSDWEYQQWLPNSPTAELNPADETKKNAEPLTISLNDIQIDNADFCYIEDIGALKYCFTQDSIKWNGSIQSKTEADSNHLSAKGDLVATNTMVRNQKLKRNLVDIKTITLTKLNLSDLSNAKFDSFIVNDFTALQRSKQQKDATVAFSKLSLSNTSYAKKSIAIDEVKLDGLSSLVSKNTNGSWEHDKWQATSTTNSEGAADKKPASKEDPLLVSIKSASINSDKAILFIDNSTTPSMEVGLEELKFTVDDLLSNKPAANSPFKLFAKTKRHSTIDIAGTVRPFAEKISFDGKGKLKGFDLRAATPVTKKAIGHIIKSGQLDADLKLLAVDGQLDTNIGLSLYQFHIKPMSKEDSAKLDKELGMPLNQTLVLLRDKDDSIHLDIPITGDINEPDFSPMHAIVKATTKAATVTLITFYTPYGLIYAGSNALFDLATAMNFDPIPFAAGSAVLPADGEKQLDNLGKLLTEKPKVHLTLCGLTNKEDVYSLFPGLKTPVEKGQTEVAPTLTNEQTQALNKLATDRQIASKNYLIKVSEVTHDRLILCEPEHQTDLKAISGVEVNI